MAHTADQLTRGDIELLALLCEELGESAQSTGKLLRHGRASIWNGHEYDNVSDLEKELGHVLAVINMLSTHSIINSDNVFVASLRKLETIGGFLHYQDQ